MASNELNSKGGQSDNSIKGNSTQISGNSPTINNYAMSEDMENFYKSSHIKAIDIIKSQRAIISKLQHQVDRQQDQIDVMQEIKNKLVVMLMRLLDEHNNRSNV
ncbi:hypothetical protein [Prevotella sp. KH2C16]|uniref:hypothetical protein n=1 Tax=Prevotella sp. KH2C16 TaxID=1855325 RepID=UPI0008EC6F17|nr:hypothetical protein [Prevotella sp. KH2C16]SFG55007.1 hypothetical protein SAMN05216383_1206 [Prevotella sp. KH2C16]